EARAEDQEVGVVDLAARGVDAHAARVRLDGLPGAPAVQVKADMLPSALERVGGRQLSHAQHLPDETPLVGVGEVAGVLQEANGLGPAVSVHVDQRGSAKTDA